MIKRRFYRFEHGDRDDPSESSSSSDSESEAEASDEIQHGEEDGEDNEVTETKIIDKEDVSSSSGYESEDSSADEFNLDSSVLPGDEDDSSTLNGKESTIKSPEKAAIQFDRADCVLKYKSVFKCRVCPKIVCLSEDTLQAHLNSKKHARSEKLLKEGKLKLMLNDKGQIEGDDYYEESKKKPGKESLKSNKRSKQEVIPEKRNRSFKNREKRRKK